MWSGIRHAALVFVGGACALASPRQLEAQAASTHPDSVRARCEQVRGATFADVLQGKIPGVNVQLASGAASGAATVRVRGVHTLRSNNPIVYIDGVRIAQLGSRNLHSVPLLEFVEPTQVGRVEVLKGPDATFRYGQEASSGVIHIYTKRAGRPASDSLPGCPP